MDISMESFHRGGHKVGALLRRSTPTELRALSVFTTPEGLYRADLVLAHGGRVRDWTAYTFASPDGSVSVRRTSPTTVEVDGEEVTVPEDVVPSYVGPLVLAEMLAGCHTEEEFHELVESDPRAGAHPAHFSVGNPEQVTLPGRGPEQLGIVTLFRDDRPTNRYWFDSHEVVASDWQGARSYHVDSVDELLDGLTDECAAAVREFLAQPV